MTSQLAHSRRPHHKLLSSRTGRGGTSYSNVTNIVVTCTTNPPRFVYVTNGGSNNVSAYAVDATSGALTATSGSPFHAGNLPVAVAVDPTGSYVYVANQTDATVSAITIDRMSGALTAISGSPFLSGPAPTSVAIDTSGSFVYVTSGNAGTVWAYSIGVASPGSKCSATENYCYLTSAVVPNAANGWSVAWSRGDLGEIAA